MKKNSPSHEGGQILVILVLALVALLAFTALAVDVGMAFSARRYDQNVADSAALAGVQTASQALIATDTLWENFNCNTGGYVTSLSGWPAPNWLTAVNPATNTTWFDAILDTAIARAATNQFAIQRGFDHQNGVAFYCETTDYIYYKDLFVDVKVQVSGETPTAFAHFVFGGALRNTVEAIAHLIPNMPGGSGDSILAECNRSGEGLVYDGNVNIITIKGHQYSNCDEKNVSNATIVRAVDDEGNCIDGGIGFFGDGDPGNEGSCLAVKANVKVPLPPIPDVVCPSDYSDDVKVNGGSDTDVHDIYPGKYRQITVNKGILRVHPGLYCIDGGNPNQGFSFTGGQIVSVDSTGKVITTPNGCIGISACGNTFWMLSGSLSITGNGTSTLVAPANDPSDSATGGAVAGMLVGAPLGYTGLVKLEGTTGDTFIGTIYIPDGTIDVGGNADINGDLDGPKFVTSLIADNIKFHGKAGVTIYYEEGLLYMVGEMVQLKK